MKLPTEHERLAARERPNGSPVMRQRWEQLLFLHWGWDVAAVQRTLPPGLTVDTFEGRAWLGVVPFFMRRVRPAWAPAVPAFSDFLELNVRTYVYDEHGRPGVWFYSLDCNRWLAVKVARSFFHLRYEHAAMSASVDPSGNVDYRAQRRDDDAESRFLYRATGPACRAEPGSLEFFLIERYRLFAHDARRRRLVTGRVWHEPYGIRAAEVPRRNDRMLQLAGFDPEGRAPDHIRAVEPVDVRIFSLERVTASPGGA
jgi:uncharacterized protein